MTATEAERIERTMSALRCSMREDRPEATSSQKQSSLGTANN